MAELRVVNSVPGNSVPGGAFREPVESTLARYGLSREEWRALLKHDAQGNPVCACCGNILTRSVIDHEHVRGWKTMPDEERKLYVRGIVCPSCNHFVLTRYADAKKHRQAAAFLDRYEKKRRRYANRD